MRVSLRGECTCLSCSHIQHMGSLGGTKTHSCPQEGFTRAHGAHLRIGVGPWANRGTMTPVLGDKVLGWRGLLQALDGKEFWCRTWSCECPRVGGADV